MATSIVFPTYVDRQEMNRAFNRIVQAVRESYVDFLFGAGMSVDSGVPTGRDLAVALLKQFFPPSGVGAPTDVRRAELAADWPFEALVGAIERTSGKRRADLTIELKKIFLEKDYPLNQAHNDFHSICDWEGDTRVRQIFTTNFDQLLTKAFNARAAVITEKNTRDIKQAATERLIPIIHLHGTLDTDYKITEGDIYDKQFRLVSNLFEAALSETDAFVFVGYSLSDPDFRGVYMAYRHKIHEREGLEKDTYVVSPAKDEFDYDLGKTIWKSRGAIWLPFTAADFFAHLKELLQSDTDTEAKARIMKKYSLKDEATYEDKVRQVGEILNVEKAEAVRFLLATRGKTGAEE